MSLGHHCILAIATATDAVEFCFSAVGYIHVYCECAQEQTKRHSAGKHAYSFVHILMLITPPRYGCEVLWSTRLSVRLTVCPRAYLWKHGTDPHDILCADHCGSGSVLLWRRCATLCTSSFMYDVTFGRSGPYDDARTQRREVYSAPRGVVRPGRSLMSMNALFTRCKRFLILVLINWDFSTNSNFN